VNTALHFSSKRDDWETPQALFDKLNAEFHFTLDAAASLHNAKCPAWYSEEHDALNRFWIDDAKSVWLNPPYSRYLQDKFIRKAYEESKKGCTVVCLIPARTDKKVWHEVIFPHAEIRFLPGRIKFVGAKHSAPFPSAIIIFRPTP